MSYVSRQMVGLCDFLFTLLTLKMVLLGELIASAGDGKLIILSY